LPRKIRPGECGRTTRGVLYCYLEGIGVRFCPRGARGASECQVQLSGNRRHGRWRRVRVGETAALPIFG